MDEMTDEVHIGAAHHFLDRAITKYRNYLRTGYDGARRDAGELCIAAGHDARAAGDDLLAGWCEVCAMVCKEDINE